MLMLQVKILVRDSRWWSLTGLALRPNICFGPLIEQKQNSSTTHPMLANFLFLPRDQLMRKQGKGI